MLITTCNSGLDKSALKNCSIPDGDMVPADRA